MNHHSIHSGTSSSSQSQQTVKAFAALFRGRTDAWVANFESKRLSERTLAGLARAKAQGQTLGRPVGAQDKKRRKKRSAKVSFEP